MLKHITQTLVQFALLVVSATSSAAEGISIINLIASPTEYNNKVVQFVGYAAFEFESNAVWLSKESQEIGDTKNAIWVNIWDSPYNHSLHKDLHERKEKLWVECFDKRHISIEGTFNKENKGHRGVYLGGLEHITRIMLRERNVSFAEHDKCSKAIPVMSIEWDK